MSDGSDDEGGACGGAGAPAPRAAAVPSGASCAHCAQRAQCVARRQPLCAACLQIAVRGRAQRGLCAGGGARTRLLLGLSGGAGGGAAVAAAAALADCGRGRRAWAAVTAACIDTSAAFSEDDLPREAADAAAVAAAAARAAAAAQALPRGLSLAFVLLESALLDGDDASVGTDEGTPCVLLAVTVAAPCVPVAGLAARGALCDGAAVAAAVAEAEAQLAALRRQPACVRATQRLRALLAAAPSPDARLRTATWLLEAALLRAAAALGCSELAQCDSADRMAAKLLALACEGGGFALPREALALTSRRSALAVAGAPPAVACAEMAAAADGSLYCSRHGGLNAAAGLTVCMQTAAGAMPFRWYACAAAARPAAAAGGDDCGDSVVRLLKPLSEVEAAELALFCRYAGMPTARAPALRPAHAGMAPIIDAFVTNLQSAFVGTVHNVTRTARKVAAVGAGDALAAAASCALCAAPLPAAASPFARQCDEAAARLGGGGPPAAAAALCFPCGELVRARASVRQPGGAAQRPPPLPLAAMVASLPEAAVAALAARVAPGPAAGAQPLSRAAMREQLRGYLLDGGDDSDGDEGRGESILQVAPA